MKILQLPIHFEFNGQTQTIYPSLIVDGTELTLVDTGYPNQMELIEKEIEKLGYQPSDLRQIIITHYDQDHIGSLAALKRSYPDIKVLASSLEAPSISGNIKSERLVQAESLLETMDESQKAFGNWFINQLKQLEHVQVDTQLNNGEKLFNGECEVLFTPGHTAGHLSLYFPRLKTVITGDAAVVNEGKLEIANPEYCLDLPHAKSSLEKILELDAVHYFCYHGGIFEK